MLGRSPSFRAETLGHSALRSIGNLCFALFVVLVLIFTIIAATYSPDDPLLRPSSTHLTSFLTSTSNATFLSDDSSLRTGDDLLNSSSPATATFITLSELNQSSPATTSSSSSTTTDDDAAAAAGTTPDVDCNYKDTDPVDCSLPEVFHLMMKYAIEHFRDIHFYKFGKPNFGAGDGKTCDMAWRFRPKDAKRAGFYKDYRRFELSRSPNCTYDVVSVGDYHSGVNARKRKKNKGGKKEDKGFVPRQQQLENVEVKQAEITVPEVGEAVNDTLLVVESEEKFKNGKYLVYSGGGDRCKSMNHYLWSFLCALGEAQYLNRTFVMDLSVCLSGMYTSTGQDEEGKDFRFYYDFEHLRDSASVLDQSQFWSDWEKWQRKDGMGMHLVEDFILILDVCKFSKHYIITNIGINVYEGLCYDI